MNKPREPSFGSLIGMAFVWFINSAVFGIALMLASFGQPYIQNLFVLEAILFAFVAILNIIAVTGTRKGKLLTIVRRTAIAGNAMFLLLGVQAIIFNSIFGAFTIIGAMLCFVVATANVVAIFTAPIWKDQQEMFCPECEYDLRGLRTRGCPECGWGRKN